MIKKTISFEGFDDEKYTEDYYFHMSNTEMTKFLAKFPEGLDNRLKNILRRKDLKSFLEFMDDLILSSYGEKSADGKHFVKTKEITTEFMQSNAYDELFMSLYQNPDKELTNFVYGIIDRKLAKQIKEAENELKASNEESPIGIS